MARARPRRAAGGHERGGGVAGRAQCPRLESRADRGDPYAGRDRRADRPPVRTLHRARRGHRRAGRAGAGRGRAVAAGRPVRPARFGHGGGGRPGPGRLGAAGGDPRRRRGAGDAHRAPDRAARTEADAVIGRLAALLAIVWALGFLWFAVSLPQPAGAERTDAVVVPTGAGGRIPRGLAMLREGAAPRMLVTGVFQSVTPGEFGAEYNVAPQLMACCVTLGFAALDTRGNARETAKWVETNKVRSLR